MAKKDHLGARLGHKEPAPKGTAPLREETHGARVRAIDVTIEALKSLNATERTAVLAGAAEFYKLTFTVDNG
jgi:hypothetical protein